MVCSNKSELALLIFALRDSKTSFSAFLLSPISEFYLTAGELIAKKNIFTF
jgi:hypothetical protein